MTNLEQTLRSILSDHGFDVAAAELEFSGKPRRDYANYRNLSAMIGSWNNFPKNMDIYPATLSKKDKSYLKGL